MGLRFGDKFAARANRDEMKHGPKRGTISGSIASMHRMREVFWDRSRKPGRPEVVRIFAYLHFHESCAAGARNTAPLRAVEYRCEKQRSQFCRHLFCPWPESCCSEPDRRRLVHALICGCNYTAMERRHPHAEKMDRSGLWTEFGKADGRSMKRIGNNPRVPTDDVYRVSAADVADKLIDRMRRWVGSSSLIRAAPGIFSPRVQWRGLMRTKSLTTPNCNFVSLFLRAGVAQYYRYYSSTPFPVLSIERVHGYPASISPTQLRCREEPGVTLGLGDE